MPDRMLVLVNHYFGSSAFLGRSTTGEADGRRAVVTEAVTALRALPEHLDVEVDVQVCGVPGQALLPLDRPFADLADPRHLPYATIESMLADVDRYDWFLNVEDDILLDPDTLRRCLRFARLNRVNEVLLPHRVERRVDGSLHLIDLAAMPGWRRTERRFGRLDLAVAVNEHAGMAILSRAQLRYAAGRVDLGRREQFHGGFMASAYANLHAPFLVWRTREPLAHSVTHLDHWLDSAAPPDLGPVATRGAVDSIEFDGVAVRVRGWGLTPSGAPLPIEGIRFGSTFLAPFTLLPEARPDVAQAHHDAAVDCGFVLTFSLLDLPGEDLLVDTFGVVCTEEGQQRVLPRDLPWVATHASAALRDLPDIPDEPYMPAAGVERLADLMARSRSYLEYGSGGSTMLAVRSGVRQLVTVESDLSWLLTLRHRLAGSTTDIEVAWRHEDLGRTGAWGAPLDDSAWRRYHSYALGIWREGWPGGGSPDLVVVDGRLRVACTLASLLHAAPGTPVLLDDYPERPAYHVLEELLSPVAVHDQLAEFVVPEDLDRDRAWDMLVSAVTDVV